MKQRLVFYLFSKLMPFFQQAFAHFLLWACVQLSASRRFFAESSGNILAKARDIVDSMKVEAQGLCLLAQPNVVAMCTYLL